MRWLVGLSLCVMLVVGGCNRQSSISDTQGLVVKLHDRGLSRESLLQALPKRLSSADSLIWAESYLKQWIKDELVYDVAQRNMDDETKAEIDRLVDSYRRSLIRYRYQEQLVKERLSANITEAEKEAFYAENREEFVLDHSLIKGLFLKVPLGAPNLSEVKRWYRSKSEDSIEKIEKYSVQNAVVYEYFYDKWVDFDELMLNIPQTVTDEAAFLRTHTYLEAADSSFCYLLNIDEFIPKGEIAPYEYVAPQVFEMLVNQRKVKFLKDFEEELYDDAVRAGDVIFFPE